ncbi:hypothetical protein Bmul_4635 [Burkholderia multivorans ATCC 17616]|nr:hypothetical protein Bmul_4635 [Burkholderia multivorans ATCC 17616]
MRIDSLGNRKKIAARDDDVRCVALAADETNARALAICGTQVSTGETIERLHAWDRPLHRNLTNADYDAASSIERGAAIRFALRLVFRRSNMRLPDCHFPWPRT